MERYIGMDVHAASCTLAVISDTGRKLRDFPVETNGQALVEAVRMTPGRKHLVFEEGLQSAWLYETLSPHVDEIVVAGILESRGPKSDKRDYARAVPALEVIEGLGLQGACAPLSAGSCKKGRASTGYRFIRQMALRIPLASTSGLAKVQTISPSGVTSCT